MKRIALPRHVESLKEHCRGSVVLVTLFMCLGLAVMTQIIVGVVVCAQQGFLAEEDGRKELAAKERALARARDRALLDWAPASWEEDERSPRLQVTLAGSPVAPQWFLQASATEPTRSSLVVSALIERGHDGFDLPLAALVGEEVVVPPGRSTPWLVKGPDSAPARAYLVRSTTTAGLGQAGASAVAEAQLVGPGCSIEPLGTSWQLDEGWREAVASWDGDTAPGASSSRLCWRPTEAVVVMNGSPGQILRPFTDPGILGGNGADPERPLLLVISGGAGLDLRDFGELWGVIVVDDGGVELDGTLLHGAVFATRRVDLGWTGAVSYDQGVLRWATDRSLWRARLLPGSRKERLQ